MRNELLLFLLSTTFGVSLYSFERAEHYSSRIQLTCHLSGPPSFANISFFFFSETFGTLRPASSRLGLPSRASTDIYMFG